MSTCFNVENSAYCLPEYTVPVFTLSLKHTILVPVPLRPTPNDQFTLIGQNKQHAACHLTVRSNQQVFREQGPSPQDERWALKLIWHSGQTVVLQFPRYVFLCGPKRLFPIHLHWEREVCNEINIFLSIQTPAKWLVSPWGFDSLGLITFGKYWRAVWLNCFIPTLASRAQNQQ